MTLLEIVNFLSSMEEDRSVKSGFGTAHSYRGDYKCLSFTPVDDTSVGEMLSVARDAIDRVFIGYKGGEFKMNSDTPCYLAGYGKTGPEVTVEMLKGMVGGDK